MYNYHMDMIVQALLKSEGSAATLAKRNINRDKNLQFLIPKMTLTGFTNIVDNSCPFCL